MKIIELITVLFISFPLFTFGKNDIDDDDYWIDRYLSVSFPLRSIHVNSDYGFRRDPINGRCKIHRGLDLAAHYEEVLAMFDGVVHKVGSDSASGLYVILQHGEYTISYCHLSKIFVEPRQLVFSGETVGISGSTGRSTGPHLHMTVRLRGKLQDPYNLLLYVRDIRKASIVALHIDDDKILSPSDFIKQYAPIAMEQQRRYGIPASVTLAQMAFESGWGNSDLARAGNNYFGIKCSPSWLSQGLPYSLHDDDHPNEKFCNFSSPEESVEYHSRLLMGDHYKRCRRYSSTDYHGWLSALKACGYATNRRYVDMCEDIIRKHKLYVYDLQAERM